MILLEGKKIAEKILTEIKKEIAESQSCPGLGVILVGNDQASEIYVNLKEKTAKDTGINFTKVKLPKEASEKKVLEKLEKLNNDKNIHGIIAQLPLPEGLNKDKIVNAIDPKKDADGFNLKNLKDFFTGGKKIFPVFPSAILELIKFSEQKLNNKKAIVIGNSEEFGKTMQFMLKKERIKSEYIFCEDTNKNLEKIKKADILITACGKKGLIKGKMIKNGAIVIDGGIVKKGKEVVGDVDFESVKNKNIFLSPVPGGVGPVTIACLLKNVWLAYKNNTSP